SRIRPRGHARPGGRQLRPREGPRVGRAAPHPPLRDRAQQGVPRLLGQRDRRPVLCPDRLRGGLPRHHAPPPLGALPQPRHPPQPHHRPCQWGPDRHRLTGRTTSPRSTTPRSARRTNAQGEREVTTANSTKAPSRSSLIAFRFLTAAIIIGAAIVGAIGFAGSYDSLKELAENKGFGDFSYFLPVGVDAGIIVLLGLDLWLTRMRIPMPLMRQSAWILTGATIYFNASAGIPEPTTANPYPSLWDDPVAVGMHSVLPLLFVATVEAARHAVRRLAHLAEDNSMDKVRTIRWFLDPLRTFGLWRRMRLWEITSYAKALLREKERLVYLYRLRARYGSRRKAPVEVVLPLRLADYGEPLPAPPLTEREEAEQAEAEARERAREAEREARARRDREEREAQEEKRREAEREEREAREAAEREAREAEREAAREAHEREMARFAAETEARLR